MLKESMDSNIDGYSFYINNHPTFWGESSYSEIENKISGCIGWVVYPLFYPKRLKFDIKVCNEKKRIFFAYGKENFDWSSLVIYENSVK